MEVELNEELHRKLVELNQTLEAGGLQRLVDNPSSEALQDFCTANGLGMRASGAYRMAEYTPQQRNDLNLDAITAIRKFLAGERLTTRDAETTEQTRQTPRLSTDELHVERMAELLTDKVGRALNLILLQQNAENIRQNLLRPAAAVVSHLLPVPLYRLARELPPCGTS
jgi:hypothetical protein